MKRFYDLKISTKLICAFVLVAALAAAVGLSGMHSINTVNDADTFLYENRTVPTALLGTLAKDFQRIRVDAGLTVMSDNASDTQKWADKVKDVVTQVTKESDELQPHLTTPTLKEKFAKFAAAREAFAPVRDHVLALALQGKTHDAEVLLKGEFYTSVKGTESTLTELQDAMVAEAKATSDLNTETTEHAIHIMEIIISCAALLAVGLGVWLSRLIGKPLKEASERAEQLCAKDIFSLAKAIEACAAGDLGVSIQCETQPLTVQSKDEVGDLATSINKMIHHAQQTVVAFQKTQGTLKDVIGEARTLTQAALDGDLNKRGADSKYQGGYREMVQGMNATLDAVVAPINEAQKVLEKMATRDLTVRVAGNYKGDFAKIKTALNETLENLEQSLSQVATGSQQVTSAATQISSGSQSLAQGASEQASSIEEVSSSLQEMSSMTKQNAANAKEARALSDGTRQSAAQGTERMNSLTDAIGKIKASADATAKIVKTIDEIAFQTNLLALNAAVEAARAGDAGKGFAVVAEEVRNLAMRSADAAKQTTNLIEESVKNADGGVVLNKQVLESLDGINTRIQKVTEVMAEIAAASEQQSQGIDQINAAVEQMNQVTQQVAANSEESAAAAEELSGQAQEMDSLVGAFVLSGVSAARPREVSRGRFAGQAVHKSPVKAAPRIARRVATRSEEVIPFDDANSEDLALLSSF